MVHEQRTMYIHGPADPSGHLPQRGSAEAPERGEFSLETIPPGEYTAIAFPDEDQYTPAYLREAGEKYERFGQHIHIAAHATTRADLTVAPVELN